MDFGPLIKYYRTQRRMTQKELAEGICSIPHLSKIEHNSKEGNKETMALLLERLGIEIEDVACKDEEIKTLLNEFDNQMTFQIKAQADHVYSRLLELGSLIPFSSHIYTYELYKYRYMLFKGNDSEAEAQQELLRKHLKNFTRQERNLFDYFTSIHLMRQAKYHEADAILDKLDAEQAGGINIGEFLYHRAFAKGYTLQSGYAIYFGKKALQHFMEQHNFRRILHTLMLLGINYTHSNIYEEASASFEHLIRNAELLDESELLPYVYHNMGLLQKKRKNTEQAIHYFEKSLSLQRDKGFNYLVTLNTLGETKFVEGDAAGAKRCFVEVFELADQLCSKKYLLLSTFYLMLDAKDPDSFKYLESKVIPLLEEGKEHKDDLAHFYKLLADYFTREGKFEQAVHYLKKMT
ncbi:helix-turn-helix domain-containing protein [Bacillus sp. FJAT-27445]|uniref:helix-turn-helix domain-containing protein n=1 Tax=Bacillus sp. FJAT-27445 TaxID=1679166 RepID=UPI0009E6846F|nr:helix-turn-helix domain-containing protein [Bacillus sp. FJAT-27445]